MAISHLFISINFIYLFKLQAIGKRVILISAIILFLISIFAKPLYIQNLNYFTSLLQNIFYIWLGVLWFLCLTLFVIDLLLLILKFLNSSKIFFFTYNSLSYFGYLAIIITSIIVTYSIINAKSAINFLHLNIAINTLPKSYHNFKIIQLSDLHIGDGQNKKWLENVVTKVNSQAPDIVAITGDLIDGKLENLMYDVEPLKNLKAKYGVYFVTGNHEFYSGADQWCNFLTSLNINVLRNQSKIIKNDKGDLLAIAGIEDYSANFIPGYSSNISTSIKNLENNIPIILLAHQPNSIDEAAKLGIKLQLSGHTHGGQIWPFNFLVKLQQPYVKGLHMHNNTALYISSGTGQWGPPMRFLTKKEISVINLLSNQE